MAMSKLFVFLCLVTSFLKTSYSFPLNDKTNDGLSRRDILINVPIGVTGAVVYGKLVSEAIGKLSRGDLAYPEDHERRAEDIISKSLVAASTSLDGKKRPLRVLEVGIGKEWRVARRGLYASALKELSAKGVSQIQLTGVDISVPSTNILQDAQFRLQKLASSNQIRIDANLLESSITSKLNFPDGWFDCVFCALTLCSVGDQVAALNEMKRMVRPNGGTFGYIEHVAVEEDEPYAFLSLQQQLFDPLQQAVADNCHLHRYTDENIAKVFEIDDENVSSRIFHERFLVDGMWPVSCQCCGVIQRLA